MEDKVSEMIKPAVAELENQEMKMIETTEIPVNRRVLVIGGGLAGIESALELAKRDFEVCLAEKESQLGGWIRHINSIAGLEMHPRVFLEEKIKSLQKYPSIRIMTNTEPAEIAGFLGDFSVRFKGQGYSEPGEKFGAVIWATGFQTKFQHDEAGGNLGQDTNTKILSITGLERLLTRGELVSEQRFAIILDEASEDHPILSVLAVKNALLLRQNHHAEVYLFHKNIKVSGDNWERLYAEARGAGVKFFRYTERPQWIAANGILTLNFEDLYIGGPGGRYMLEADYLVLPDEIQVIKEEKNPPVPDNVHYYDGKTPREGIYLAGSCRSLSLVDDIRISVWSAVGDIARRLSDKIVPIRLDQPQVQSNKCVVCLTCYRCCPHGAISIVHDETIDNMYHSAAKMNPLACRRCGICAAECPAKAIRMPGISDDLVFAQIEALQV